MRSPLPGLSLQQLDYLVAVADAPTWAAAAAELGVTPSALSQGLSELERRLNVQLFERVGRRRVLAPATSAEVLTYARRVVQETRDLTRHLEGVRTGRSGRYRLGMIDAAALGHWPHVLQRLRHDYETTDLELTVAPSGELLDRLIRGHLDLAVVAAPTELAPGLKSVDLLTEPLAIYGPDPDARSVPRAEWGPWVLFPSDSHTRQLIDQALIGLGVNLTVTSESHQPEVLKEMVELGLGWTVLPVIQAEHGPHRLVRATPEPLAERRLIAAQRSTGLRHPLNDQLLDWLASPP